MSSSSSSVRKAPVWLTALLGLLALVLIVVAVLYFVEPAHKLPSFFPGHTPHGKLARTKHGIAAAVVAVVVLAAAWFSSGRKRVN